MANEEQREGELDSNTQADRAVILDDEDDDEQNDINWKATAMRYKKQNRELKNNVAPARASQTNPDIDAKLARLELKTEGYTDDAITFLMKNGGKESLKDPHIKAAIDSIQEQRRAEAAVIVSESSKSDIERKFTQQEIAAMSVEEMEKVLRTGKK